MKQEHKSIKGPKDAFQIIFGQKGIIILVVVFLISGVSCAPQHEIVYLHQKIDYTDTLFFNRPEHRIVPGDILMIRINSLDERSNAIFNPQGISAGNLGAGGMSMLMAGYLIDSQGQTVLPVLGTVVLGGKTLPEAQIYLEGLVARYIIDATVSVNLLNFSVTVTGEVRNPGRFSIYDNNATIFDAITMAGDLTDFGKRKIHIVRRTSDGTGVTKSVVDLTDPQIISSEFFFLQPNDLIYVEPHWAKRVRFAQPQFGFFLSILTTGLLIINFFRNY